METTTPMAPKATNHTLVTLRKRQRTKTTTTSASSSSCSSDDDDAHPLRLFRPNACNLEVWELLLERHDLTTDEILSYCCAGGSSNNNSALHHRTLSLSPNQLEYNNRLRRYQARRIELQELNQKLHRGSGGAGGEEGGGGARIDDDGRLVPVPSPAQQQQQQQQPRPGVIPAPQVAPPPPPPARGGMMAPPGMFGPPIMQGNNDDNDDDDDINRHQWIRQQEQEAAEVIARAVQRYRALGGNEDDAAADAADLVLLRVPDNQISRINLTVRRICFAVAAVVGAFLLILIKTLPPAPPRNNHWSNPAQDRLMEELLHVKQLTQHAKDCPRLDRSYNSTWWEYCLRMMGFSNSIDCSDGVLHIPSTTVIIDEFIKAKTTEKVSLLEPFVTKGVNITWFMDCVPPPTIPQQTCYPGKTSNETVCRSPQPCFRGVHDAIISKREVDEALRFGSFLIVSGGDHFDIRYDINLLEERLFSIVERLRSLLHRTYNLGTDIQPVAYRVSGVAPMDGSGVSIYGIRSSDYLVRILNRTNYIKWMDQSDQRNDLAQFSLPWPFRIKPVRDTCNLMADMEADPRFAIHTTVFLSDGAGEDYHGGVALYVDHHRSNGHSHRRRIRRGLTVDGTRGRVLVSTGGLENRRCRLPTRAGVRAALQIWWNVNMQ